MKQDEQAKAIFHWANCPPGLTVSGLLDHRKTTQRQVWARVLAGSDDDLASVIEGSYASNFNLPDNANKEFALHIVEDFESVLTGSFPMERWRDFAAGWSSALNNDYKPTKEKEL